MNHKHLIILRLYPKQFANTATAACRLGVNLFSGCNILLEKQLSFKVTTGLNLFKKNKQAL